MLKYFFYSSVLAVSVTFAQDSRQERFLELYSEEEISLPVLYSHLEGLKGEELLLALHKMSGQGYKDKEYHEAKSHLYDVIDNFNGKVKTVYSGLSIAKDGYRYVEVGDQDGDGNSDDFVNCEHIWPQSKFAKLVPMVSDLHHLYPALSVPNRMRSDLPFGVVKSTPEYSTRAGSRLADGEFEPSHQDKGNVARAMLYFYTRYLDRDIFLKTDKKRFFLDRIPVFLEWNQQDRVDGAEKERNDRIQEYQGNRNPYIDFPGFADRIGKDVFLKGAGSLGL
ncbi:MAG: endonuclease [Candidatus Cloacimonetes bacterium]|nr:endonuclease [Candidatus Cloacimonadota bacterium]